MYPGAIIGALKFSLTRYLGNRLLQEAFQSVLLFPIPVLWPTTYVHVRHWTKSRVGMPPERQYVKEHELGHVRTIVKFPHQCS
jgi:hypothetical protein